MPQWFVDTLLAIALAALIVVLVRWTLQILGAELNHFMKAIGSEVQDFRRGRKTVGAINWYGFITVAVFGAVVIVAMSTQKVFGIVLFFISEKKANELVAASNYFTLMFVLAAVLVISLAAVVIDNRSQGTG